MQRRLRTFVQRHREAGCLSAAQLAEAAGLSLTAITHAEDFPRRVPPEVLAAIAGALQVPESALWRRPCPPLPPVTVATPGQSRVELCRRWAGLSQVELAAAANVSVYTLRSIERRISGGRPATRQALARALATSVDDLFPPPPPPTITELRRAKGLSLPELAAAAGMSALAVRSIERGRCHGTEASLTAIASVLGVFPFDL